MQDFQFCNRGIVSYTLNYSIRVRYSYGAIGVQKSEAMNLERMSQIPDGTIRLPAHELLRLWCLWRTCGWKLGYLLLLATRWRPAHLDCAVGRTNNTSHANTGRCTNPSSCHTKPETTWSHAIVTIGSKLLKQPGFIVGLKFHRFSCYRIF